MSLVLLAFGHKPKDLTKCGLMVVLEEKSGDHQSIFIVIYPEGDMNVSVTSANLKVGRIHHLGVMNASYSCSDILLDKFKLAGGARGKVSR